MAIAIIIGTHGAAAEQLLKTAEMLLGEQDNVAFIDFVPGENAETLIVKYNEKISGLDTSGGVLFLVDTWGGSPFNAASRIAVDKENYEVVTGVNIPMLVETFMARDDNPAFDELVALALETGREGVKALKKPQEEPAKPVAPVAKAAAPQAPLGPNDHMKIGLARIDDRLIHGQVATRWTKETNVSRIIVVSDEVAADHVRNQFEAALLPQVQAQREDAPLKLAVAGLKHRFLSKAEALLHGDIHSGSIFVAEGRLKAIDAEFGFYGPIGFDVGTALGNLLLNYCGQPGLFGPRDAAAGREQRLQDVRELWLIFADRFLALCHQQSRDAALATPGYAEQFLLQVWTDAIGYCGTELIRRTIGLAHVADLDSIADADMRLGCQRHALGLGRTLIVNAPQIEHIDALLARIRQQG